MAERSKRICLSDSEKISNINPETMKLYKKYKIDMELRELSANTIFQYEHDLFQWFIYVYDNQSNQCITELNEDDLVEFFYYCKTEGNNSRRMKRRMSSISAFYKYLRKKKIIVENPTEYLDRPKKDVDILTQTFLTSEQVAQMRKSLNEYTGHRALDLKLYALFSLSTMARVTAVSSIRWEQIDFDERICSDVLEKEGKIVTLYFSEEVKEIMLEIIKYRKDNNIDDGGYVFYTNKNGKISNIETSTLNDWCKKIGELIGVPTLHPHDFRHSGSQLLKLAGCPIEQISELLHHEGLDTTKKFYLRPDRKQIQREKDKYVI